MPPTAAHAPPGYEFVRPLGSGGFGDVYLARHRSIGRLVAIKEIAPHALGDPDNIERFRREARVLAATSIASVIKVYDLNTGHDPAYLVMEYVAGGTLSERLANGPMPAAEALPILADVANALRSMAALGLVHRDIKPDNVFVTPDGTAKLGDFGLARALVDDSSFRTAGGAPIGTPAYFPPEVSQGSREPDHWSDAYSFAVMAYQTLTGSLPFDAPDAISMITAHWRQVPRHPAEALPGIPAAAADALLAGLAKEPDQRPLPDQLVDALRVIPAESWPTPARRQAVTGSAPSDATVATPLPGPVQIPVGVRVPESSPPSRTPRRSASRRRRIALVAGAVLLVGAVGAGVRLVGPWSGADALAVRGVSVDVRPDPTARCPRAVVQLVAEISTNGAPGELSISWTRPDGVEVPARTAVLADGQRTLRAELTFTFSGNEPQPGRVVVHVAGDDEGAASRRVRSPCPAG